MKLIFCLLLTLVSAASFASDKGNGGDSVANRFGGRSLLDLSESDDVDYFTMSAKYWVNLHNSYGFPDQSLGAFIDSEAHPTSLKHRSFIHVVNPVLGDALAICMGGGFRDNFPQIRPLRWAWVNGNLEDIKDEGQIKFVDPSSKRQVAIQKDGIVFVNRHEFYAMDANSKGALKLHESLICAVNALNPNLITVNGTAPIRQVVRAYVGLFSQKPGYVLQDAVDALHIAVP